ncbi:MAG: GTP-binding protein era [Chloroflexi bacterium OLB15]|nr:MAG: GTP-binding protein era [Chloroflexi bacterium OLB15]
MNELDSVFDDQLPPDHQSGVVAVVGRPNVGKSTLINRLIGQKIAIVSPKPQTTRRQQLGIYTDDKTQILFIDTPGLHAPQHKLGEYMVKAAETAFRDADVILLLMDLSETPDDGDRYLAETVQRLRGATPVVLAVNKGDIALNEAVKRARVEEYAALLPHERLLLISAQNGDNVDVLLDDLKSKMPMGPRYYPADQVSEVNMRFIAAEVVREKVMISTEDEIPYAVAVEIDSFRERSENLTYISAVIYVERDSQKGIVIGKNGEKIKQIGSLARAELSNILGTSVYLELNVKVAKNWRSDEDLMRRLGYRLKDDRS